MKSLFIIPLLLVLAACTPPNGGGDVQSNSNVTATAPTLANDCGLTKGTLKDEKALFAAETAYNVPADAYVRFDAAGKLPAGIKATARPLLIQAYDYLKLARAAYAAGDGCSLKNYSDLAQALGNQAKAILPK